MSEYTESFSSAYKLLTRLGLWSIRTENPLIKSAYYVYQSWSIFFLLFFFSCCIMDLYTVQDDVHRVSTNLSSTMTVFMLIWKNSQALRNHHRIEGVRQGLARRLDGEEEENRKILMKATKEIKLTSLVVYFLGGGVVSTWMFFVYFFTPTGSERRLPLPITVPWPHKESPYFEMGFLFQAYGGYFVAYDVLSINLTIFGTIMQMGAEYDILINNTQKMMDWYKELCGRSNVVRALTEIENREAGAMLIKSIRHHQKIIHLVSETEKAYVHMMGVHFGGLIVLITMISLDLVLTSTELDSRVLTMAFYLVLTTSELSLLCSYGSRLMDKNFEFLNSISGLPWEAMNATNRKSVCLIIMKAQRPPKLTIEKIANIDNFTLLNVAKIIYNVLYLLLQVAK